MPSPLARTLRFTGRVALVGVALSLLYYTALLVHRSMHLVGVQRAIFVHLVESMKSPEGYYGLWGNDVPDELFSDLVQMSPDVRQLSERTQEGELIVDVTRIRISFCGTAVADVSFQRSSMHGYGVAVHLVNHDGAWYVVGAIETWESRLMRPHEPTATMRLAFMWLCGCRQSPAHSCFTYRHDGERSRHSAHPHAKTLTTFLCDRFDDLGEI
jgi:hypothetical protein